MFSFFLLRSGLHGLRGRRFTSTVTPLSLRVSSVRPLRPGLDLPWTLVRFLKREIRDSWSWVTTQNVSFHLKEVRPQTSHLTSPLSVLAPTGHPPTTSPGPLSHLSGLSHLSSLCLLVTIEGPGGVKGRDPPSLKTRHPLSSEDLPKCPMESLVYGWTRVGPKEFTI